MTSGCSAGAPVYVYQQEQEQVDAGGALAALLPLGALALLVPLGILAFGTLFPATTIVTPAGRSDICISPTCVLSEFYQEASVSF